MRKGLFWLISGNDNERKLLSFTVPCNQNGIAEKVQPAYNSRKGGSFSHERTWPLVTKDLPQKIRGRQWNYFMRGRVEIANGKAIVYHSPRFSEWPEFESAVLDDFELENIPVRFIPDHSQHYQSEEEV